MCAQSPDHEIEDLLDRTRVARAEFRRLARYFSEWLGGPDASPAAEVAARVETCVRMGRPASIIRLGDGEGKVLAFGRGEYPLLTHLALERLSQRYFGIAAPLTIGGAELRFGLDRAIAGASILGVPTAARVQWNRRLVRDHARGAPELLGVWFVHRYLWEHRRALRVCTKAGTDANFHKAMLDHVPALVPGRRIGLVTCHESLRYAFRTRLDADVVAFHPVPPPAGNDGGRDRESNRHYPERYRELIDELSAVEPGVLYLVGAGMPGKVYCEVVRRAGGIALDIGHGMDILAGVRRRRDVTHEIVERYRIVT